MDISIKTVKLSAIKLNPNNPRRISTVDMDRLVKSLQDFPDMMNIREIVVDETMTVLGGNMRTLALRKTGAKEVTAKIVKGLTEAQKREFVIKDNGSMGEWSYDDLANSWSDLPLGDWGVPLPEDWLTAPTGEPADAEPQIDRAEELNKVWKVAPGDLWKIGNHVLLCGDSTKAEDVARVMGGEKATLIMADPPYNVEYTGGSTNDQSRADSYADKMTDGQYTEWLRDLLGNAYRVSDDHAALLLWFASAKMRCILDGFEGAGWTQRTLIVWNKLKAHYGALGAQYKHRFEPMWYCYKPGKTPRFFGETNECTVWDVDQPRINDLHPTMKPVELYSRCIKNHSEQGGSVLELFGGSGTTIVACENLGRKGRALEKTVNFTAVILQRMTDAFPGIEIKRIDSNADKD